MARNLQLPGMSLWREGRISEKCKYGCALSRRSEISHRRTSGGSAAILAAASGILPDGLLFSFSLAGRMPTSAGWKPRAPAGNPAQRRSVTVAISIGQCRHRENMATVAPVVLFGDAPWREQLKQQALTKRDNQANIAICSERPFLMPKTD